MMISEKSINTFKEMLDIKGKLLNDFKKFRYDYIEDYPDETLLPDMPNYSLYKCRTHFFATIASHILRMHHNGIRLSMTGEQKCEEFMNYCKTLEGRKEKYKKDDIDKANEVLDILISELE